MQDFQQHELDYQTLNLQQSTLAADQDVERLTAGLGEDFICLKKEFDGLLGSLSNSVHDATKLTLEHTTLYDSAVGELQVACHFMPLLRCIPLWTCTPCMLLASTHICFMCVLTHDTACRAHWSRPCSSPSAGVALQSTESGCCGSDHSAGHMAHLMPSYAYVEGSWRCMQSATEQAVATAQQLAQRCIALSKELRGTDLLAERTRRLRKSVEALEHQVNRVL